MTVAMAVYVLHVLTMHLAPALFALGAYYTHKRGNNGTD